MQALKRRKGVCLLLRRSGVLAPTSLRSVLVCTMQASGNVPSYDSKDVREEKKEVRQSLAEILKANRIRCKMTQEFVSEAIGVSRQAVSKWEKPGTPKQRKEAYHPAASFFYREKATAAVSF